MEAAENVLGWSAEDVWVVEESPQQQEERVECEGHEDEKDGCDGFYLHGAAGAVPCASGAVCRKSIARSSQVRSPYTSTPLAPKFGHRSSMFLAITYELTIHPSAQPGGLAIAHHHAPGI